jgi:hypothetical protein
VEEFATLALLCCTVAAWAVEEKVNPPKVSAVAKRKALKTNNISLLCMDIFLLKKTSGKTGNVVREHLSQRMLQLSGIGIACHRRNILRN